MAKDITGSILGKKSALIEQILGFAIVVCIIIVLYKIYKAMNTGTKIVGQAIGDQTLSIQTGIPAARIAYIRAKAQDLWDNSVTNWGFTFDYTEDDFLSAINEMSNTTELGLLNGNFKQFHRKAVSIKEVVRESFSPNEIARIKGGFYSYLLST